MRMKIWWSILLHDRWYVFKNEPFKQCNISGTHHQTGQVWRMEHLPISGDHNTMYHYQNLSTCQIGNETMKQTRFSSSL